MRVWDSFLTTVHMLLCPIQYAYSKSGQLKMVKECFTMGFNVEAKSCIVNVADDLKWMGVYFTIKLVQNLETDSNMAFLGVPIDTAQNVAKQLVDVDWS